MGRLVGGSTAINGGTTLRPPPWVLDRWCEEMATSELSPDAMKLYFERVERVLQVAPSDRSIVGPIADVMARGCNAMGWSHFSIPRNAPGCDGAGFCDFGCRTDARRSTNVSYVPSALEKGSLLLTGLRARRVLLDGGRATGIEGVTAEGRVLRIRARVVVLAGGAIPSPLLLLDQGICNSSGQVGRNLSTHPSTGFGAYFDEPIRGHAHVPQGYACDQFLRDGELITAAQPDLNLAAAIMPLAGRRLMEGLEHIDRLGHFALLIRDSTRKRPGLARRWGLSCRDLQGDRRGRRSNAPGDDSHGRNVLGGRCEAFATGDSQDAGVRGRTGPRRFPQDEPCGKRNRLDQLPPPSERARWAEIRRPAWSTRAMRRTMCAGFTSSTGARSPGPLGVNPRLARRSKTG
jgi:choline dehydrogenase-like flavoprotein